MTSVLLRHETASGSSKPAVALTISGDIDALTATDFGRRLDEALAGGHDVDLDLSGVTFFGSAGVHVLDSRGADGDRTVTLVGCSAAVQRTLDIAGWPKNVRHPS